MNELDPALVEILACPQPHHAPVRLAGEVLVCTECGLRFPIRAGIPIMLVDEALPGGEPQLES